MMMVIPSDYAFWRRTSGVFGSEEIKWNRKKVAMAEPSGKSLSSNCNDDDDEQKSTILSACVKVESYCMRKRAHGKL